MVYLCIGGICSASFKVNDLILVVMKMFLLAVEVRRFVWSAGNSPLGKIMLRMNTIVLRNVVFSPRGMKCRVFKLQQAFNCLSYFLVVCGHVFG